MSPQRKQALKFENPFEISTQWMENLEKSSEFSEKEKQILLDFALQKMQKLSVWISIFDKVDNIFKNESTPVIKKPEIVEDTSAPTIEQDEHRKYKCDHCSLWWPTDLDAYECCAD